MSYVVFYLLVMLIGFANAYDFHAGKPIRYNVAHQFANFDFRSQKYSMQSRRSYSYYSSATNSKYFDASFSNFFSASASKFAHQSLAHSTSWSIYQVDFSARSYSQASYQPPSMDAPKLVKAAYSSDGAVIKFSFEPSTGIIPAKTISESIELEFPCNTMFEFTCKNLEVVDSLQCIFTIAGDVELHIKSESYYENINDFGKNPLAECLEIDSEITVKAGTYSLQPSSPLNTRHTVKISTLSDIITPSAYISAPLIVGGCDDVTLDSFIIGSSGRYMRHIKWEVSIFDQDDLNISTSNIIKSLDNQRLEDTIKLKRDLFVARAKYIISLSACTFFSGQYSESEYYCFKDVKVSFDVTNESIPLVKIVRNEPKIKITKIQTIYLNSFVINNCPENAPYVYEWSIGGADPSQSSKRITSQSKDRSILKLDIPESYSVGSSFFIILEVNGGSDKVEFEIVHGYIYTIVSNSSYLSAYVDSTISILTSKSYDEDRSNFTIKPKFSDGDEEYIEDITDYSSCYMGGCDITSLKLKKIPPAGVLNFKMYAEPFDEDERHSFFTDEEWFTKNSVQMFLEILDESVPLVSIQWPAATSKFNANDRLTLLGGIQGSTDALLLKSFSWSIGDENDIFEEVDPLWALTNAKGPNSDPGFFYLVISSNKLIDYQGSELFFKFTCVYGNDVNQSSKIKIVINDIPAPGFLFYTPQSGEELVTMFTLTAKDWSDFDMPLSYQFNYALEESDKLVRLRSSSIVSTYSTILPVGKQFTQVTVFDSLNAFNVFKSESAIEVMKSNNTNAFDSIFDSLKLGESNQLSTDQVFGTLSLLGSSLNVVECSHLNCHDSYNRLTCELPNTCGPCADDSLIGVPGSSNSKCLDPDDFSISGQLDNTCATNGDCVDGVSECIRASCQAVGKKCIGDCNGHGECMYLDAKDGSTVLDSCVLTDQTCFAKCFCRATYAGAGCDLTKDEMKKKQQYRAQMLDILSSVLNNTDITSESLDSFISLSNSLTSNPDELSDEGIETSLHISDTAINSMQTDVVPISSNLLSGVFSSLSNLGSALKNMASRDASGRRRLDAKIRMNPITESMGTVAYLSSKTIVLGQISPTTFISDTTRIDVRLESGYNDNTLIEIPVPFTPSEFQLKFKQPLVSFAKSCISTGSVLTIITQSTDHLLLKNDLESSKNDVVSSNVIVQVEDDCSSSALDSFTVAIPSLKEITADIDNQLICESLFSDSACSMQSYTSTEITCKCDPVTSERRKLSASSGKQYIFDVSAALKYPAKLVADEKGWVYDNIVNGAVTIVIIFGFVGMWYVYKSNTDRNFKYKITKFFKYITGSDDAIPKTFAEGVDGSNESGSIPEAVKKIGFIDFQNALPASLRSGTSYFSKVGVEIRRRHRWLRITNNDSSHISPYMKIFSLLTSIFLVMFFEALIFHYFYPRNNEDPKCAASSDRTSCEDVKSIYYHNVANCRWSDTRGYCTTVSPNDRVEIVVLVAIFAVFVAYPLIELCDYLIFNVLCRSSKDGQFSSSNFIDNIRNACNNGQKGFVLDDKFVLSDTVHEFLAHLKRYRDSLGGEDRDQFDQTWRINDKYFMQFSESPDRFISESVSLKNLRDRFTTLRAQEKAERDLILAEGITDDSAALGKRLLYLFQLDLLDLNPERSQIVASNVIKNINFRDVQSNICYTKPTIVKEENDSELFGKGVESSWFSSVNRPDWISEKHAHKQADDSGDTAGDRTTNGKSIRQAHAWLFILILDFWILFYLYWFAAHGPSTSQSAWLKSFIAWSVADIVFLSPLVIVVVHILLPSLLIGSQLESLRCRVRDTLASYKPDKLEAFNSARYLLLSHRLSLRYPHLEESKVILSFSTPKPLNIFDDADAAVNSLSYFECVLLCFGKWLNKLLKLPIFLTDFVVVEVVNIFVAYLLLGIVALCRVIANSVSPFLIFILSVPFLLICACVYYLLKDYGLANDTHAAVDNKAVNISIDDTRVSIDEWYDGKHTENDVKSPPSHSNAAATNKTDNMASISYIPTYMNDSDSDHERSRRPGQNYFNLGSSSGVLLDVDSNSSNSDSGSDSDSCDSIDDSDVSDADDIDDGDIEVRVRDVDVKVQIKSPIRRVKAADVKVGNTVAVVSEEVLAAVDKSIDHTVSDILDSIVNQALGGNDQSDFTNVKIKKVKKEKKKKKETKEKNRDGDSDFTDIIKSRVFGDGEKKDKKEKKKEKKSKEANNYDDNIDGNIGYANDSVESNNKDVEEADVVEKSVFAATKIQALFRAKSIRNSPVHISGRTTSIAAAADISLSDQASSEVDIAQRNVSDYVDNTAETEFVGVASTDITEIINNNSNTTTDDVIGEEAVTPDAIGSANTTPSTKKDKKKKDKNKDKSKDNAGNIISDAIEDLGFDGAKKEKKEKKEKKDKKEKKSKESKDNDIIETSLSNTMMTAAADEASTTMETSVVESRNSYVDATAESVDASSNSNVPNIDDSKQDNGDNKSPKKKGGKKKGKEKENKN
jgi:hypothetical protein